MNLSNLKQIKISDSLDQINLRFQSSDVLLLLKLVSVAQDNQDEPQSVRIFPHLIIQSLAQTTQSSDTFCPY